MIRENSEWLKLVACAFKYGRLPHSSPINPSSSYLRFRSPNDRRNLRNHHTILRAEIIGACYLHIGSGLRWKYSHRNAIILISHFRFLKYHYKQHFTFPVPVILLPPPGPIYISAWSGLHTMQLRSTVRFLQNLRGICGEFLPVIE